MSYECGQCGEIHLGQVNRCWKCHAPIEVATNQQQTGDSSPFSPVEHLPPKNVNSQSARDAKSVAAGLIAASIVLGLTSLLTSQVTGWILAPALTALACGLLAVRQRRDWLVILAILIALMAVYWSGSTAYDSLQELYLREYDVDMWY